METRSKFLSKFFSWLPKWWKCILAFLSAVLFLFIAKKKKSEWQEFHENSKENLENEIDAIDTANKKEEEAILEADEKFNAALSDLKKELTAKSEELKKEKTKVEKKVSKDGIGQAIAEMTGADYIKEEE